MLLNDDLVASTTIVCLLSNDEVTFENIKERSNVDS
jgi:hypothetical protein